MVLASSNTSKFNNPILEKVGCNMLTLSDVLHLSVVYWNSILQILRSSHVDFKHKMQQTIDQHENLVFNIVYNSLSCVLFTVKPQDENVVVEPSNTMDACLNALNQCVWELRWIKNENIDCDNNIVFIKEKQTQNDFKKDANIDDEIESNLDSLLCAQRNIYHSILHVDKDVSFKKVVEENEDGILDDRNYRNKDIASERGHLFEALFQNIVACERGRILIYNMKTAKSDRPADVSQEARSENMELSQSTTSENVTPVSSIQKQGNIDSFLSNIKKVGHFMSENVIGIKSAASNLIELNEANDYSDSWASKNQTPQFFSKKQLVLAHSLDLKKIFMNLFEVTLGVMICDNHADDSGEL